MTRQRLLPLPIPEDPVILTLMEKRDAEKREGNFGRAEKLDQRIYKRRHDALRAKYGRKRRAA